MATDDFLNRITIWEGQHIGDATSLVKIDKEILHCKLGKTGTFLDEKIVILKYNTMPLIMNAIKMKFRLSYDNYLRCMIKGEEVMLCKHKSGTLTLKEFSLLPYPFYDTEDEFLMSEIQRCIVFRYLFFIPENDDAIYMHILGDSIYCHITKKISVDPITKYITSYDLSNNNLPVYSIARFFKGDNEVFHQSIIKLLNGKSTDIIREFMIESISQYDNVDKHMEWVDAVYNRIKQFI